MVLSAFTPSASSSWLPSTTPAFTLSAGFSFAKSTSTLASATGSSPVYAMPVVPSSFASRRSSAVPFAARSASEFFTTR